MSRFADAIRAQMLRSVAARQPAYFFRAPLAMRALATLGFGVTGFVFGATGSGGRNNAGSTIVRFSVTPQ